MDLQNKNEHLEKEKQFMVITLCGSTRFKKEQLDKIHFQKINMADEIFVINVGGYIGSSTAREIAHAKSQGIPVRYLEQPTSH